MVAITKKQSDVVNSSGTSRTAVDQKDAREPSEKNQHRDLEAGRSEDPSLLLSDDEDDDDDDDDGDPSPPVTRISTNVSLGPDNPVEHYTSFVEVPDSVYDRIPARRKLVIVALLSYCAFLAPISSTTVLSATPEVAAEFRTTGSVVDVTNALYMLFMGISPIVWGPFSEVWGRKVVSWQAPGPSFPPSVLPPREGILDEGGKEAKASRSLRALFGIGVCCGPCRGADAC